METDGAEAILDNNYGDIVKMKLDGTKSLIVDNQYVVAWTSELEYTIEVAAGVVGFKTGEGLANEFHETGTVLF
ncbi:AIM24 family protein [Weissella viridescens]|uniref:AIM24 family protein n=1 Tax=Weissella viridescens TaxID=1629 RepID=UPI00092E2CB7|nr:AIM24 family protein [Weissella viridescens]